MADTTVTAQVVIDNSIARAKDSNKTQWSDDQMLKFLNKGVDYVHRLLIRENSEIAINDGTISLTGGVQEYSLPDDLWCIPPNGVYFSAVVKPITPVTYEDKIREGVTTTDSAPESYYITDDKIGLVLTPSGTAAAAYTTLNCRYFKKNTALAFTDNMPYKNLFNEPISMFMDNLALFKAEVPTEEIVSIFNALEAATIEIINQRIPV